ncbi:cell division protein PerM [Corynebacterium macclintockiae]|uniref:cell division protein PerM n=1 Tax=Corynebacterium macclintockiae TaxID=2913501 RepID=UPI003EB78300
MSKDSAAQRPGSRRSASSRRPGTGRTRRSATSGDAHRVKGSGHERFVAAEHAKGNSVGSGAKATPTTSGTVKDQQAAGGLKSTIATWWSKWKPHVKRFGPQLLINHAVTVGVIVIIAVLIGIGAGFAVVPASIASMWMTFNLAPVEMAGAKLGFVPLLPAVAVVWGHAKRATTVLGNSISVRGLRVFTTLSLLIPLLFTCIAWLMLWDASRVYDVTPPNLLVALIATALVNGAAIVIGMRARVWRALLLRRGWSTWPVESVLLAGRFLKWMSAAGAIAALVYLLTNLEAFGKAYDITTTTMGVVGLTFVALLYVPNVVIGAVAVLLGGEFHVGNGAVCLFTANNVNLPPVPILAAIPNDQIPFGPALLAVPAAVAVGCVYTFLRGRNFVEAPLLQAVGAGAFAGFIGFCVSWLAGGEMGVYGHAGAVEWLFAVELAAWLLVPAAVMMFFTARRGEAVVEDIPEAEIVPTKAQQAEAEAETDADAAADADAAESAEETDDSEDDAPTEEPEEGEDGGVTKKEQEDTQDTEESDDEDSDSGERDGDPAPERD